LNRLILRIQMTLKSIQDQYRKQLKEIYPQAEIDTIYAWAIGHVLEFSRADLIIHGADPLEMSKQEKLKNILKRLMTEEPIQYILGKTEFYGLELMVNSEVLIPRPETEELVRWILDVRKSESPTIVDLGTGSGCIALALKSELPKSKILGLDKSRRALKLARINAEKLKLAVRFETYDILKDNLQETTPFDVLVSNPPYVRYSEKEQMKPNVLKYEPEMTLFVYDKDPLIFYNKIADIGKEKIRSGGLLFFEINEKYGDEISSLLEQKGYAEIELRKDLNGRDRMIKATKN